MTDRGYGKAKGKRQSVGKGKWKEKERQGKLDRLTEGQERQKAEANGSKISRLTDREKGRTEGECIERRGQMEERGNQTGGQEGCKRRGGGIQALGGIKTRGNKTRRVETGQ